MHYRGDLFFGSEIKSLLQAPDYEPAPDREALFHYLAFNYIPGRLTAFSGVSELAPGAVMEIRQGETDPVEKPFFIPLIMDFLKQYSSKYIKYAYVLLG